MSRVVPHGGAASSVPPPMPAKVLMFVRNPFEYDSRVLKQAQALIDAGVDVKVTAVATPGLPRSETRDGLRIERVDDDPAPTRLARRALEWLARRRVRRDGGAQRGAVIGVEQVGRPGVSAVLLRALLRLHLLLALQRWWREGLAAARAEPADVYVAHDLDALPIAVLAKARLGGGALYDSHELWIDSAAVRGRIGRLAWRELERWLIRRVDRVISVSEPIADELATRYRVARPSVVLNVPDGRGPAPGAGAADLRARLDIPAGRLIALHVGGLSPGRGIEEVVRAAALLEESIAVVLMGPVLNARYAQDLRGLVAETAGDRVILAPPVPGSEVVAYAASADIGLVPQRASTLNASLTLPNKLFECIAAGLPVVANDLPALRAVVGEYELGVLCDGDRPQDIARAVSELADDPKRRAAMARNARRASAEFSWERQREVLVDSFSALAPSRST